MYGNAYVILTGDETMVDHCRQSACYTDRFINLTCIPYSGAGTDAVLNISDIAVGKYVGNCQSSCCKPIYYTTECLKTLDAGNRFVRSFRSACNGRTRCSISSVKRERTSFDSCEGQQNVVADSDYIIIYYACVTSSSTSQTLSPSGYLCRMLLKHVEFV